MIGTGRQVSIRVVTAGAEVDTYMHRLGTVRKRGRIMGAFLLRRSVAGGDPPLEVRAGKSQRKTPACAARKRKVISVVVAMQKPVRGWAN